MPEHGFVALSVAVCHSISNELTAATKATAGNERIILARMATMCI